MQLATPPQSKDLRLNLALRGTEFLQALRGGGRAVQSAQASSAGVEQTKLRTTKPRIIGENSDVVARFSTRQGTLVFTGILYRKLPIHFLLKPGSRSYANFLEFLLGELRILSEENLHVERDGGLGVALKDLQAHLEKELMKLDRQVRENLEELNDIVEVFTTDFEQFEFTSEPDLESGPLRSVLQKQARKSSVLNGELGTGRSLLAASINPNQRRFRLLNEDDAGEQLISGFFSLEIEEFRSELEEEIVTPALLQDLSERAASALRGELKIFNPPAVVSSASSAEVSFRFHLSPETLATTDFYLHWGPTSASRQDGLPTVWVDEEISRDEIERGPDGIYLIRRRIIPEEVGSYGATVYARPRGSRQRFWFGVGEQDNARFDIQKAAMPADFECLREELVEDIEVQARVLKSLVSYERFIKEMAALSKGDLVRDLGRLLFEATKSDRSLRARLSDYYEQAVRQQENAEEKPPISRRRLGKVISLIQNLGVGELVFVTPEGPHAIAGGLAQVIVGLTKTLSKRNLSCTVLTPLYEEAQGNKHRSAEELIDSGVMILGTRVPIDYVGKVRIDYGPSYKSHTREVVQFPRIVECKVYRAEHQGIRIFFLRHPQLANRLYSPGSGDEQLRKAIFLSRGALEVLRDRRFGVSPHVVISNDWLSGLIPLLLKTDKKYVSDVRLRQVETLHLLHNGGREYQGRLYANQFGEDLWPLLNLADEHYFGISDPEDRTHLNLTAAAIFHATQGVVAVSRPYARQLLTESGGEGLHTLFQKTRKKLYGISNGVDLAALRTLVWQLGENARAQLGLKQLLRNALTHESIVANMDQYKLVSKSIVQAKYKLEGREDALLISMVGRLAEQKGIQLLCGRASGENCSVLESLLRDYPEVQFILGGPPSLGDPSVEEFARVVSDLSRRYPGRIVGVFDFIPHEDALEITQSSDLFLMPSRYEPGGITQLEALATGTLVIARKVGGLAATLQNYSTISSTGNSFLFLDYSSDALLKVSRRAIETMSKQESREALVASAATAENDWGHRAPNYLALLQHASGVFHRDSSYPHLQSRARLVSSLRA